MPRMEKDEPKPKEEARPNLFPWVQWAEPLNKGEADKLAEPLKTALEDYFEYIDKAIWKYTGDTEQQPIWSDMTAKETNTIVRVLLRRAQRSKVVATAVYSFIAGQDYLDLTIIVGPRAWATIQATLPKPKGKKGRQP